MRFNLISKDGDGVGFAIRLQAEGNDVRVFIEAAAAVTVGDGLVPKVGSIYEMLEDADPKTDVFVFDTSGDGIAADYIRDRGYAVIGGSAVADRLERERDFGLSAMQAAGIEVPKSIPFSSFGDAKKYVEKNAKKRLVYKPSNLLGDKSVSHVSYNSDDMLQLLTNVERDVAMENPDFVLQEFEEGLCISTEMWYDGSQILPLWNHTFERKELMNDNIGPSGGCSGNIVWACGPEGCPICAAAAKLEPWLRENNYHGPIDLNAIVSDSGLFGLEFTPRFGYDATPTLLGGLIDGEIGHFLHDVAKRQYGSGSPAIVADTYASGVRITVPPYPAEVDDYAKSDVPIFGLNRSDDERLYLYNVKRGDRTELATAGAWGILMLFIGQGDTVSKSLAKPYRAAKELHVADKQYRTDLRSQFEEDFEKLEALT